MTQSQEHISVALNLPVMMDLAWDEVFGHKIDQNTRAVLDMVFYAGLSKGPEAAPSLGTLMRLVAQATDREAQTAKMFINRAVDVGLIEVRSDATDSRRKLVHFTDDTVAKYFQVNEIKKKIVMAVAEQLKEPQNPRAGSHLTPPSVYTNIWANED